MTVTDSESVQHLPEPPNAPRRPHFSATWTELRTSYLVPTMSAVIVILLVLVGGVTTKGFLSTDNMLNIVRIASLTGIMALGMTFVTMSGNFFSLAVAQTGALASIAFASAMVWGWGWTLALLLGLVVGLIAGGVLGLFVAAGANPIVITIAGGAAIFGLSAILTDSRAVIIRTESADWIGTSKPLGIPIQTVTFIVLSIAAQFVLTRTRFGRTTTLVGANRAAARASGLPVGRIAVAAFMLSGLGASIAGVFVAAQSNRGLVSNLEGVNLEVVAAVLVGGTAIQGGEGSMFRTTLGALFIVALRNLLILRGYDTGVRTMIEGLAIVAGVSLFWIARGGRTR